jgi:hypothetical protein
MVGGRLDPVPPPAAMTTAQPSATSIGVYSIGVRGVDVPELLSLARDWSVPFVHLRGGPRGVDLVRRETSELTAWRHWTEHTVPISGVTADLDLADILADDPAVRANAGAELAALAGAARCVGARWVRLLARTPPGCHAAFTMTGVPVPDVGLPLLVEPHEPAWWSRRCFAQLTDLLARTPSLRLLADTAQLNSVPITAPDYDILLNDVLDRTRVVHICDNGSGVQGRGHRRVVELTGRRIMMGQPLEVALEWTGVDRSPTGFLTRYRSVSAWWAKYGANQNHAPESD